MLARPSTFVWMLVVVLAAFGLYMVKYKVQALKIESAAAEKELREEKKNLHVLAAEWAFLNRPDRLRQLSAKYLNVAPLHSQQMAEFASFPYNPVAGGGAVQPASDEENAMPQAKVTLASGVAHER